MKTGLRLNQTKAQRERSLQELHTWNNEVDRCAAIVREKRLRSATRVKDHPPSKRAERPVTTHGIRVKPQSLLINEE